MAVIDVFTYNGEADILDIRLNILYNHVDRFIIVEADETFSGKKKELYYENQKERFAKFADKITYHIVRKEDTEKFMVLAHGSPNTRGADHWKREFCQKECIKDALIGLSDDDICFIGDVDEVWNPDAIFFGFGKIGLRVYSYYLNNLSSEIFSGTVIFRYKHIRDQCLNHVRSSQDLAAVTDKGWHFTSIGGYEEVKRKLSDSYTRESYWTEGVEHNLRKNLEESRDFLGRDFKYTIDESEWPQYLKKNREKYLHLLRK